jgi:hypothetical protein
MWEHRLLWIVSPHNWNNKRTEKRFMIDHLYGPLPIRVPLGTSAPKEGAGVAVKEETPQEKKKVKPRATGRKLRPITDVASSALGRKGR